MQWIIVRKSTVERLRKVIEKQVGVIAELETEVSYLRYMLKEKK